MGVQRPFYTELVDSGLYNSFSRSFISTNFVSFSMKR